MTYGLTAAGFIQKPFNVLRAEVQDYQRQHIDSTLNHADDTVISQVNLSLLNQIAELWQQASAVYSSQFPDTSSGFSLVQACALTGTLQNNWEKTTVPARVTLNPNRSLPAGSVAHLDDFPSVRFVSMLEVPATATGGTFDAIFEAEVAGSTQVAIGQLNSIAQPVQGWTAVTNLVEGIPGSEPETDDELRAKRERELAATGSANLDAIVADVSKVQDVVDVTGEENESHVWLGDMAPHSVRLTVRGGTDTEIAQALYSSKAAGIGTNGDVSVTVTDSQGIDREVKFRRAVARSFHASFSVQVNDEWNLDREANVKALLAAYVNALVLGSTIQHDRCLCAIYGEPSVVSVSNLLIGLSAPPAVAGDIALLPVEYVEADTANIAVTVLP